VLGHDSFLTVTHRLFEEHPPRPNNALGVLQSWFLPAFQQTFQEGAASPERFAQQGVTLVE
jgi:hypothetical protein